MQIWHFLNLQGVGTLLDPNLCSEVLGRGTRQMRKVVGSNLDHLKILNGIALIHVFLYYRELIF